jgi:hypothetical protein
MKELEEETRRLTEMYVEEKLRAEIAREFLTKKRGWQMLCHLKDNRWP